MDVGLLEHGGDTKIRGQVCFSGGETITIGAGKRLDNSVQREDMQPAFLLSSPPEINEI